LFPSFKADEEEGRFRPLPLLVCVRDGGRRPGFELELEALLDRVEFPTCSLLEDILPVDLRESATAGSSREGDFAVLWRVVFRTIPGALFRVLVLLISVRFEVRVVVETAIAAWLLNPSDCTLL